MEILQFEFEMQEPLSDLHFKTSFSPFLQYFKDLISGDDTSVRKNVYQYIINTFDRQIETDECFDEPEILKNFQTLTELVYMTVMPVANADENRLIGLGAIFPDRLFYYTPLFKNLLQYGYDDSLPEKKIYGNDHTRNYYALILQKCYGIKTDFDTRKIIRFDDLSEHTSHFYRIETDTKFIAVTPLHHLPVFNEHWGDMLCGDEDDFKQLVHQLPLSLFKVEGFAVFNAVNVTADEAIHRLKNAVIDLHVKEQENVLNEVEKIIGILLENTKIKIGIVPFFKVNNEIVTDTSYYKKTILISTLGLEPNEEINPKSAAERFINTQGFLIMPKVNKQAIEAELMLSGLLKIKVGSYAVIPLRNNAGEILGILELATEKENGLSRTLLTKLDNALPLITDLLEFMISRFDEKISWIIKHHFTSLQASVEWKFNEAAWQFIRSENDGEKMTPNVVFEEVFPLHGAIDIRNSSVERNNATRADMVLQLQALKDLYNAIAIKMQVPFLEDLYDKSSVYFDLLSAFFNSDMEKKILDFMLLEVYPTLTHLGDGYPAMKEEIDNYFTNTNPKTGNFHINSRAYEASLQKINQTINNYLESERLKQYELYPHYFEKYRTDGVEYTLYIGQSLKPGKKFNPVYLRNLRLWQLSSMAFIGNLTKQTSAELLIPM